MKKLLLISLLPSISYAFSVDNMILVSNKNNNGIITISSTSMKPEYIKGTINKLDITNGKIDKVKLTKDNLPLWDMTLIPNKIILNPGERRRLSMKNLCQKDCDTGKDRMYQVVLIPTKNDLSEDSSVGINLGYAPIFIIPTKKPRIDYSFSFSGGNLKVNNTGNTMLYMNIDNCNKGKSSSCNKSYTILSGRIKTFKVPSELINNNTLKIRVANHDYSYNEVEYVKGSK
ncbi:hypothetical protein [Photobacterium damselae]|uniref:hypothetical protein n=1 Tax=Photobacterium damselae TaxID=38293 RepID=UPI0035A8EB3E